jgi:serine phosphatase RsbU (regulator of sigma subunit)
MSDGLVAGWNPQGVSLGVKRLDQIIAEAAGEGAAAVKAAIVSEWEDALEDQEPGDDMTLLVLERLK